MFAASYSLIFAWHPELCLPRQMVVRGYNHSLEQLSDMSYLTSEQLAMRSQITASQLQDCILNVHSKKGKNAISEMFNTELKFACDVLMCCFNEKFRKTRANLTNADSTQYRRRNPITSDTKCAICDFGIEVEPKGLKYKENNMSYLDFLIKKEYSFLKNIFDENDLKESKSICNLENYHDKMQLFLHLIKVSEIELKSASFFSEISDDLLEGFLMEYCDAYQYDVEGLVENEIKKFEVKHNKTMKMPKFTLQFYSFLYDYLMNFPSMKFGEIKTVTRRGFMKEIYRVVNFKVHIHHSHATGKIRCYSHDFFNWKVRENQLFVPLIGRNFLGFDIYYMVKGYRSVTWGTKEFHMGGTNLTNVNFANISSQVKIIDTLKYYQTSLANISSTANEIEKRSIKESINFF